MKAFAGVLFALLINFPLFAQQNFNSFSYSSYFGGSGMDIIDDVAVDSAGNIYVLGTTSTPDFDHPSPLQIDYQGGFSDVFVAMLTPDGREVTAFTYFGGSQRDEARSIAITEDQNVVVTGITNSPQLPNSAFAYKNTLTDGIEAFAVMFSQGLTSLQVSTYLGGTAGGFDEDAVAVATLPSGTLMFGFSAAPNATVNVIPEDSAKGGDDILLLEMHNLLVGANRATFFGGVGKDYLGDVALGANDELLLTGWTSSQDLPATTGALQDTNAGGMDGFVAVLDSSLSPLRTTYFGGDSYEKVSQIEANSAGEIIVAGISYSDSLGVNYNGLRSTLDVNISDVIAVNLSYDLTQANAFTYLGGVHLEYLNELVIGPGDDILLAGSTRSSDFPAEPNSAYDFVFGGPEDGFATQMNSGLSNIKSSTFIGDTMTESCRALALGKDGMVIQAGYTTSPYFALSDMAEDSVYEGFSEGFIVITEMYPVGTAPDEEKPKAKVRLAGNRAIYEVPSGEWQLRVFDIMGRNVYQISLGSLPKGRYEKSLPLNRKGIYIIQLVGRKESMAGKFYFPGRN